MAERRAEFERAAKAAAKEGHAGERHLVDRLSAAFQRDPASFDPRHLSALSPRGIVELLRSLDMPATGRPLAGGPVDLGQPAQAPAPGWADLRRPERSPWLAGIGFGTAFGIVLVLVTLLLSIALN